MRKICLLSALLMLLGLKASAQENISVGEVLAPQGRQTMIPVMFHFNEGHDYVSYQFTVNLPDGISLVTNDNGKVPVTLGEGQDEDIYTLDLHATSHIVTCYSNPSTPIGGTDGLLICIPIQADESIEAGTVLNGSLTDVEFTHNQGAVRGPFDDISFTIKVTDKIILDENNTWTPYATDAASDLLVKRTIKAGEWSSICFPFAMSAAKLTAAFGEGYDLEEFKGYDVDEEGGKVVGLTLNFTKVTTAAKINTPYIIKTSKDITEFEVNAKVNPGNTKKSVVIEDDETGEEVEVASMTGTYQARTIVPKNSLFLSGNKFWYSTGMTKMKAFRAYFTLRDVLSSLQGASVKLFIDGVETGIGKMENGESIMDNVYDLGGRRIDNPQQRGVYIVNGQKVVVK